MNISTTLTEQLSRLIQDYERFRMYAVSYTQEFLFTTYFEKLVKILGWDPWNDEYYQPLTFSINHDIHYGARLTLNHNEYMLAIVLNDQHIASPSELKAGNVDMTFAMRDAFTRIADMEVPYNVRFVWFTSIRRNYIYHIPDEKPVSFFSASPEAFERLQPSKILKYFVPYLRFRSSVETGVNLAFWLNKWEKRLLKETNASELKTIHNLLDFLLIVTIMSRACVRDSEKNLLENLLRKYIMSRSQQFMLEVDFRTIIPEINKRYAMQYCLNFFNGLESITDIPNHLIAEIVEEIVCHSRQVFSIESIGLAYHLLSNDPLFNQLQQVSDYSRRLTSIPVFSKHIELGERSIDSLSKLRLMIDGSDVGLIVSAYDRLAEQYHAAQLTLSNVERKKASMISSDLLTGRQIVDVAEQPSTINIPQQIIANLRIVHTSYSQKRMLTVLLLRKCIDFFERDEFPRILFPKTIHFV